MSACLKKKLPLGLLLLALPLAAGCGGDSELPGQEEIAFVPERTASVRYVIDGDTLVLEDGERIRFFGINAPEIRKKSAHGYEGTDEPWGRDAANFVGRLVEGKEVGLIFQEPSRDKYGRTLAYVVWKGELLQSLLLREGYARYADYGNDLKYGEVLRRCEAEAQSRRRGLWAERKSQFQPPSYLFAGRHGARLYASGDPGLAQVPEGERFRLRRELAGPLGLSDAPTPAPVSGADAGDDGRFR